MVLQRPHGPEHLVEAVGEAGVAGVHHDALVAEPPRVEERVLFAGQRLHLVLLAPDGDRVEPLAEDAFRFEPPLHRGHDFYSSFLK